MANDLEALLDLMDNEENGNNLTCEKDTPAIPEVLLSLPRNALCAPGSSRNFSPPSDIQTNSRDENHLDLTAGQNSFLEVDGDGTAFQTCLSADLNLSSDEDQSDTPKSVVRKNNPNKTLSSSKQGKQDVLLSFERISTPDLLKEIEKLEANLKSAKNELVKRTTPKAPLASQKTFVISLSTEKSKDGTKKSLLKDMPIDFGVPTDEVLKFGGNLLTNKTNVHSGDTSSSEDEMNRNPENTDLRFLSEEGRQLKKSISQRNEESSFLQMSKKKTSQLPAALFSSTPREQPFTGERAAKTTAKKPSEKAKLQKSQSIPAPGGNSGKLPSSSKENFNKSPALIFLEYFRIRVMTPKMSSIVIDQFMGDKVRLSDMRPGWKPRSNISDWLTLGVVVEKTLTKTSASGNQYSIWRLSDLLNLQSETAIKLFLFGEALNTHWKISTGTLIALKGPSLMDSDKNDKKPEVKFRLTEPSSLIEIGVCPDFGTCLGVKKQDGNRCNNFVNKMDSNYCPFHIYAAERAVASRRGALQALRPTPGPSWEKKALGKKEGIFYGGQSVFKSANKSEPITRKMIAAKSKIISRASPASNSNALLVSAGSKRNILEEKERQERNERKENPLLEFLQEPSAGARNLLASISNEDDNEDGEAVERKEKKKNPPVSALKFLQDKNDDSKNDPPALTKKEKNLTKIPSSKPPMLGRGLGKTPGASLSSAGGSALVSLSLPLQASKNDRTKMKAVSLLKKKGPLAKIDPNAPPGCKSSKGNQSLPTTNSKRTLTLPPTSNCNLAGGSSAKGSTGSPEKKKTKLGGGIEESKSFGRKLFSEEDLKKIANSKSSHSEAIEMEEKKRQDLYFKIMEEKEKIETKMTEISEVKDCKVVSCKKCDYTWHVQSDLCKREGHFIQRHTATKRFYKCKECKTRTMAYDKIPRKGCRKCGERNWERTGMREERKGPTLEAGKENLKIKDEEVNYAFHVPS